MKFSVKGEFNGEGFKMLSKELCTKAISAGFRLVKNGRKKRKNVGLCQEFVCNESLIYKKWKHVQLDNFVGHHLIMIEKIPEERMGKPCQDRLLHKDQCPEIVDVNFILMLVWIVEDSLLFLVMDPMYIHIM